MNVRTIIVTTSVVFALVVPAAQAANSSNRLFQTQSQIQTTGWDKSHRANVKAKVCKKPAIRNKAGKCIVKPRPPLPPTPPVIPVTAPAAPATSPGVDEGNVCVDPSSGADAVAPIEESTSNAPPATSPTDHSVNESPEEASAPVEAPDADSVQDET